MLEKFIRLLEYKYDSEKFDEFRINIQEKNSCRSLLENKLEELYLKRNRMQVENVHVAPIKRCKGGCCKIENYITVVLND